MSLNYFMQSNLKDKAVDEFVKDNFDEESISKIGVARCFEELLDDSDTIEKDSFEGAEMLINWIIKSLNLK